MSDPSVLRRAVADDEAVIRSLTREAYSKWVPVIGREPKPMTADYAEALRNHRIDLLYLEGRLAGLIEMIPETEHPLIENVAVAPAFQGKGLGWRLMTHAEQVAASSGYSNVKLYTDKFFAEDVRLYRTLSYEADREKAIKGGFTVYMSKSIRD